MFVLVVVIISGAESLFLPALGDLYTEIEEFEAAVQAYEQAEAIAPGLSSIFISNYLILARANLALLQRRFGNCITDS